MARRKALRGMGRVRRLLRRLPVVLAGEIIVELTVTGRDIMAAVKARTPRRTGRLQDALSQRVLPTSLRLQVGLLGRDRPFYGRIQDLGRTEQVVNVIRRVKKYSGPNAGKLVKARGKLTMGQMRRVGSPYLMAVPTMAGKRFVTGRYPDLRRTLTQNLRGIFARALSRSSGGSADA